MATTTPNYNLRKPADGDFVNVGSDINASMDTIDVELFEHEDRLDDVEALLVGNYAFVYKSADESVTSSTTLQDDNHLFVTLPEVGTYIVEFWIIATSASDTPDVKYAVKWTGTADVAVFMLAPDSAATSPVAQAIHIVRPTDASTPTAEVGAGATTSNTYTRMHCLVRTSTPNVVVTLQWAQLVSNATASTVLTGSHVESRKVA